YTYVVQDDCWSVGRNASGALTPDPSKFPHGIAYVADGLHQMGLGFGIYSDAGALTCGLRAGSLGYETIDAQTWAAWGVDYLKYDNCFNEGQSGTPLLSYTRYNAMARALNATGRPILYSMCNWGEDAPWNWAQTIANSWRITGDSADVFDRPDPACPCSNEEGLDCKLPGFRCAIMNVLNKVANFPSKGITGAWNDLDILQVGLGAMSDDEYLLHFSMWAAVKSPLILGMDLSSLSPATYSIISNAAILAVSQDPGSGSVFRIWRHAAPDDADAYGQGEVSMWTGGLSGGDQLVVLLNAANSSRELSASLEDIFWDDGPAGTAGQVAAAWDVYDVWGNRMDADTAAQIIAAAQNSSSSSSSAAEPGAQAPFSAPADPPPPIGAQYRYNATAMGGYGPGLAQGLPVLLGKRVGAVPPRGALNATVPRHGVGVFRLRQNASAGAGVE
ncbi:alpha-galactosidase/alpha-n-acetylgalactosaminidase, partial [Phellopilus nigrolimitatus]